MNNEPVVPRSIVACVNKDDGAVFKVGTASRMVGPALLDPSHVMLGAGCDDWGVCLYLTVADAARLNAELGRLLADLTQRG